MDSTNADTGLRVGASVREITVAPGTPMAGFAARVRPSTGVQDPLTVRALVIDNACWITIDVCGLDESTCTAIRERVQIPADRVVVSATHTHSGPCSMLNRLGRADPRFVSSLVDAAIEACTDAVTKRTVCTVSFDAYRGLDVARNRRHPDIAVDPQLQVMVFTADDGSVLAWLLQFPCHPVVLGADNRLISGDYPAFVRQSLEQAAPGSIALFLTGAAGDINTGHSAESSYSQDRSPIRTFNEAERVGRLLAFTGHAAQESAALRPQRVQVVTAEVRLELEVLDEEDPSALAERWELDAEVAEPGEQAILRIWADWARARTDTESMVWTGTVTVMNVAGILLVALPGEPFLAGAELIERAFGVPVVVAGYSNGCPGYFPAASEYSFGGYEVMDAHRYYGMPAPFKRGSLEKLVQTAVMLGSQLS